MRPSLVRAESLPSLPGCASAGRCHSNAAMAPVESSSRYAVAVNWSPPPSYRAVSASWKPYSSQSFRSETVTGWAETFFAAPNSSGQTAAPASQRQQKCDQVFHRLHSRRRRSPPAVPGNPVPGPESGAVALLVLLAAAAGAWIVAPDFVALDDLFLARGGAVAAHELQLLQLSFLLALDIAREVLNLVLRLTLLLLDGGSGFRFVLFSSSSSSGNGITGSRSATWRKKR